MMAIAFDAVPAHIAEQMGKVGKNFRIPLTDIGAWPTRSTTSMTTPSARATRSSTCSTASAAW
jgi:hypothetical protein